MEGMLVVMVIVILGMMVDHPILFQETLPLRSQDHREQGLIGEDEMEW